jgi:general secretion pathway protein C
VLEDNGKLEEVFMEDSTPSVIASAPRASRNIPFPRGGNNRPVRTLKRNLLKQELSNLPQLMSQARVVPHLNNGENDGFLIQNIVPGSLYARIGLRNNDVIHSINGTQIATPEQAMNIYNELKDATHIEIKLTRNGRPQSIEYNIQ